MASSIPCRKKNLPAGDFFYFLLHSDAHDVFCAHNTVHVSGCVCGLRKVDMDFLYFIINIDTEKARQADCASDHMPNQTDVANFYGKACKTRRKGRNMKKKQLQKILVPILCAGLAAQPMALPVLADTTTESTATSAAEASTTDEAAENTNDAAATTDSTSAAEEVTDSTSTSADPASTSESATTPTQELVRGRLNAFSIDTRQEDGTDVSLTDSSIPNLKKLYFAIWSARDGQDDLTWFEAGDSEGFWYKEVKLTDFKPKSGLYDGTYNVHCYAELEDGTMEFIRSTTFEVSGRDPVLSIDTKTDNEAYTATVHVGQEVIPNAKKIYFAVWSAVNGQDDMRWLTAEDQSGDFDYVKTYTSDIQISDFKGSGLYNVHCYAQMADGSMKFLGSTTFNVKGQESLTMFRLYNPNSGEHFYTGNQSERDHLVSVGWKYEGVAWDAPTSGTPVYRLYNPNAGDHHYTGSEAEKNNLVKLGWKYEGVAWYSAPSTGKPQYRLYNPNSTGAGGHFYTGSTKERDDLVKLGWNYEGIGWYGV